MKQSLANFRWEWPEGGGSGGCAVRQRPPHPAMHYVGRLPPVGRGRGLERGDCGDPGGVPKGAHRQWSHGVPSGGPARPALRCSSPQSPQRKERTAGPRVSQKPSGSAWDARPEHGMARLPGADRGRHCWPRGSLGCRGVLQRTLQPSA